MKLKTNALLMAAAALLFCGCSSGNGAASSATSTPASSTVSSVEPEEKADLTIGKDETGKKAVILDNATGKTITGIALRASSETDFQGNLMDEGSSWANGKKAQLFYTPLEKSEPADEPTEGDDAAAASIRDTDLALNEQYEMRVTFEDGAEQTIYAMPFDDIDKDAKLEMQDDILFVSYVAINGDSVSTLEAQKAQRAAEEQQQVDEAAQPVEEEPVYEEPIYEEPVYEEPIYEEPTYYPPNGGQDVGNQGGDGCLDLDALGL